MNTLKGKWAVILGASSGMGLASAQKLANAGMKLVLIHRDRRVVMDQVQAAFDEMARVTEVLTFNTDALQAEKREEIIQALQVKVGVGEVHLLLHSIAKGNLKRLAHVRHADATNPTEIEGPFVAIRAHEGLVNYGAQQLNEEDFSLTLQAMGTSMWTWVQALINKELFSPKARVIGLTSEGHNRIWPGYGAVAVAKSSLETLSRYMAVELGPLGIRTNVIQAGITPTVSMEMIPGSDLMIASAKYRNPLGRLTTTTDVANAVYLLCLPEADWINGTCLIVDGGEHLT